MSRELLLSVDSIEKGWGGTPLFHGLSLGLFAGERVGLIGPNGSGKTTLLRVLAGLDSPDRGTRALRRGVRLGYVPQEPEFPAGATVGGVLDQALGEAGVADSERVGLGYATLGRAGFPDPQAPVAPLSGGWKKRLAIARAVVAEPGLLLLDEPTNHLDVEGILWLESLLAAARFAYLAVSHDRWFLEHVARRVIELNRIYPGGLLEVEGSYSEFLERRDQVLAAEEDYRASLQNRVRREIEWLRRGAKARTRKAAARVGEAERMIDELADARDRAAGGRVGFELGGEARRAKRLLVATGLSQAYSGRPVLDRVSLILTPGMRLGVLGPNGSGKTTLLRALSGELKTDGGSIERLAGLRVFHFEQDRARLDPAVTLRRALAPEGDTVLLAGQPVHVLGWARRFLFRPEQMELRVSSLSGGERARLLLARAMLEPADVLLMDEPTNDLDIPTLEVLEEALTEHAGALVLVTHDRYLLERVATAILAISAGGRGELYADYGQWESEARRRAAQATAPAEPRPRAAAAPAATPARRLSWAEKREWEGIEAAVEQAEAVLAAAEDALADPAVAADPHALAERWQAREAARAETERLWARWAELDGKQG